MDQEELPRAVAAAEAHSRHVRRAILNAESGSSDPRVIIETLREHWRDHGETYEAAGKIVLDQLRLGLLAQLYGWRQQLSRQLESQRTQRRANTRTQPSEPDPPPEPG